MRIEQVRKDLRGGETDDLWRRRAGIGLSLLGLASMVPPSLLQTGMVSHLPDPPIHGFNSDKVNLSRDAFPLGIPDGPIALAGFALNIPLAAIGGSNRTRDLPLVPLMAVAKAAVDTAISGWLFYKMPTREKAWCIYCILAFLTNLSLLALTVSEGKQALAELRK